MKRRGPHRKAWGDRWCGVGAVIRLHVIIIIMNDREWVRERCNDAVSPGVGRLGIGNATVGIRSEERTLVNVSQWVGVGPEVGVNGFLEVAADRFVKPNIDQP